MSEEEKPEQVVKTPKDQEKDFVDKILDEKEASESVMGIKMRPPTLGTIAILTKMQNALVTGTGLTEESIMMECLVFMWVHTVEPAELHGSALLSTDGRNLAIERQAIELGDKIQFKGHADFEKLYQDLNAWINKHVESKVEPIPDKDAKPDHDPNE